MKRRRGHHDSIVIVGGRSAVSTPPGS
jgi:hypothetical protein